MSGGGKQVSKGRMGCAVVVDVTPQQLKAMERELETKRTGTAEHRERLRELEQSTHELEKQLNETKLTLKKHQMDIKVIIIFIFQYALIHQSDARSRGWIKTYILFPVFCYCTVRIVSVNASRSV